MKGLRLRLSAGAVALAALAILGAFLAAFGIQQSLRLSEETAFAQRFIDAYGNLSGRISDLVLASPDRRDSAEIVVRAAISVLHDLTATDIERAETTQQAETRALRGQTLARMQGSVELLLRDLPTAADPAEREAIINSFAAQFAPLLAREIELQRLRRNAATEELRALHRRLLILAVAIALVSPLVLGWLYLWLIRPLVERLNAAASLARQHSAGTAEARRLPVGAHDELGHLFARINLMTARLERDRRRVEADRNRLETVVAERTKALSLANMRLERIDRDRRRFFADVGHELRTPMTVILAESELGLAQAPLSETEARNAFGIIAARARRLSRRIDDLLRIARSESGQIEFANRDFDPAEAARGAIEDLAPLARRAGVELVARLTDSLRIHGDEDWTRQLVAGLIDNAIRHSPTGTTVEVSVERQTGGITLAVCDEGEGVPESDQARVFERHIRGKDREGGGSRATGFGVGLALARWVMMRQGGRIVLESPVARPGARGPGTQVSLHFAEAAP